MCVEGWAPISPGVMQDVRQGAERGRLAGERLPSSPRCWRLSAA